MDKVENYFLLLKIIENYLCKSCNVNQKVFSELFSNLRLEGKKLNFDTPGN